MTTVAQWWDLGQFGPLTGAGRHGAFIASGRVTLNAGDDAGTVTGLAMTIVPTEVYVLLSIPDGQPDIRANRIEGSLSSDGFRWILDGQVPGPGYYLVWWIV